MNKILKSYKTNNHGGGELETTFFREFQRTVRTSRVVCNLNFLDTVQFNLTIVKLAQGSQAPTSSGLPHAVHAMYKASADDCGTVQALANELDGVHEHSRPSLQLLIIVLNLGQLDGIVFELSKRAEVQKLPQDLYAHLLLYFQQQYPTIHLRSWLAVPSEYAPSIPLLQTATFFDYVIVKQNRYTALNRTNTPAEALIAVQTSDSGRMWVGELLDILSISQSALGTCHRFGHVRWFKPSAVDVSNTVWKDR